MAKKWSEVIASQEYQSLPHDKKIDAQGAYFREVVAPQVPHEKRQEAFKAFMSEYPVPFRDPTEEMTGVQKFAAGYGSVLPNMARGVGQMTGLVDQASVDEANKLEAPLMNTGAGFAGNIAGNIGAAIPAAFVPGANTHTGASLIGAGMGALQPTAIGESRLMNTAIGAGAGLAGQGLGKLAGKAASAATNKVAKIESDVAAKAAAEAAAETATARSAAGNAAQNAYRQLEHLRELGALRSLTPDEAQIVAALEKELADKAGEKIIPAIAQKNITANAFREAIETEPKRAAELAAKKLSGSEAKQQAMARLKRYGPAVVGGLLGNLLFPGVGGAISGVAGGLYLRPALRSMINLGKNPAVQHKLLSPIARNGLLNDPALPQALGLLAPSIYAAKQ